jgi:hypothetical protein
MASRRAAIAVAGARLVVALLALAAWPAVGHAYVRTVTAGGKPVFWNRGVVQLAVYVADPPPALPDGELLRAATAAASAWSRGQNDCTSLEMRVEPVLQSSGPVGLDGVNRITFRRGEWCREPRAASDPCYDESSIAVTSIFAREDGELLDVDVELNGQFTWDDLATRPAQGDKVQDLQNTLTRELGHVAGLDNTCTLTIDPTGQLDVEGRPVPPCLRATQAVRDTTMFAAIIPGDLERRSLAPDDIHGVCDIYRPVDVTLGARSGGCSVSGRPGGPGLLAALAFLVTVWRRGGRPRRRRSPSRGLPRPS